MTKSKDYNSYWVNFERNEFIGNFDGMYQNIEDPWLHGDAKATHYNEVITAITSLDLNRFSWIVDLGCGKGSFTLRIADAFPRIKIKGIDIAATAIKQAQKRIDSSQVQENLTFEVASFLEPDYLQKVLEPVKGASIFLMCDILWYLLHDLENFWQSINVLFQKNNRSNSFLLISQTFYPSGDQKYLKEICSCPKTLALLFESKDYKVKILSQEPGIGKAYHALLRINQSSK